MPGIRIGRTTTGARRSNPTCAWILLCSVCGIFYLVYLCFKMLAQQCCGTPRPMPSYQSPTPTYAPGMAPITNSNGAVLVDKPMMGITTTTAVPVVISTEMYAPAPPAYTISSGMQPQPMVISSGMQPQPMVISSGMQPQPMVYMSGPPMATISSTPAYGDPSMQPQPMIITSAPPMANISSNPAPPPYDDQGMQPQPMVITSAPTTISSTPVTGYPNSTSTVISINN